MNNKELLVKSTLKALGMRPTMHGYMYLVDVISAVVDDPHVLDGINKGMFSIIALRHNTNAKCVERCIRHAIADSYTSAPLDLIEDIFGNSVPPHKDKPTAKHYIAAVADYVRDQLELAAMANGKRTPTVKEAPEKSVDAIMSELKAGALAV